MRPLEIYIGLDLKSVTLQWCINRWTWTLGSLVIGYESKGSKDAFTGVDSAIEVS